MGTIVDTSKQRIVILIMEHIHVVSVLIVELYIFLILLNVDILNGEDIDPVTKFDCVSNCVGVVSGDYQSCLGCNVYVSCADGVIHDNRPCAEQLVWDDNKKTCDYSSTTCHSTTSTNCVADCENKADGNYASCLDCQSYASCSNGEISDNNACPVGLMWDELSKSCQNNTYTCTPTFSYSYTLTKQWDGQPTGHGPINITLLPHQGGLILRVNAPFFNDPGNPGGEVGEAFPGLWDYEVVEAFFLSEDANKYLEVEICPHGQHIVLLLNGSVSDLITMSLPMKFDRKIYDDGSWYGKAVIPAHYFPAGVNKFNAFAIHGSGEKRMYEALYPAEYGKHDAPNFHRLEYFKKAEFARWLPTTWSEEAKELWEME